MRPRTWCRCCSAKARRSPCIACTAASPRRRRTIPRSVSAVHAYPLRHRRAAERRQVDTVQRTDARPDRGRELPLLHHRPERGRGPGPRSAARTARGHRAARRRSFRPRSSSSTSPDWSPEPRRAKASAISFSRTSARSMRSRTWCAVSRAATSSTWPGASIRSPTSISSTPSWRSRIWRRSRRGSSAPARRPRAATRMRCGGARCSSACGCSWMRPGRRAP